MNDDKHYKTIGEAATALELPQHVLRYWETQFDQLVPIKPGDNRRYYDDAMMQLLQRIKQLLYTDGYTIKGAQKILTEENTPQPAPEAAARQEENAREDAPPATNPTPDIAHELGTIIGQLKAIRSQLREL